MLRTVFIVLALASTPALAVGERIILPQGQSPYVAQMKDTLCISMECVAAADARTAGLDATIVGKMIKGKKGDQQVELQVISSTGAVKATVKAPATDTGRISSMDLVAATSAIIAAIEAPEPSAKTARAEKADGADKSPAKHARAQKKKSQLRIASKTHGAHGPG